MPLKGSDNAGLFCIMLPQPLDRSIKALETLRPYEYRSEGDNKISFANNYMLLAIRDWKNKSGLLCTVRSTLDPTELARTANRPGRLRPVLGPNKQLDTSSTARRDTQARGLLSTTKRKREQAAGQISASCNPAERNRTGSLKGDTTLLSDDDFAEPLSVPCVRSSSSRARVQQQTPISPRNSPQQTSAQNLLPQATHFFFTVEQARQIHFVWKIEFEGVEYEVRRSLDNISSFCDLLDSFREEVEEIPSAGRQMKASIWTVRYRLPDGTGKAVLVKPSSRHSDLNFEGVLRHLAENEMWKKNPDLIIEVEVGAIVSSNGY